MRSRPLAVLRAPLGRWGAVLGVALSAVALGAAFLLVGRPVSGVARIIVAIGVLLAFAMMVAAVTVVTLRWRTSLRSDGEALVVRGPFGASIIPFHEELTIGRWLDSRSRPRLWVVDAHRPLTPLSGRLGSARVEAFAGVIDVPVIDHDGPPPEPDDGAHHHPPPPESSA